MSHFIGLVFHDCDTDLESLLAPFNEQDENYFQFIDRTNKVMETWEKLPEHDFPTYDDGTPNNYPCDKAHYPTIDSLAKDWFGYEKNVEGKWGYKGNPNAKWDWYAEGGRWEGFIKTLKDSEWEGEGYDCVQFNDIDWDYMLADENIPFNIVTAGGEWKESGDVGWWGMVENKKPEDAWHNEVRNYVQTIRNEGYADRVWVEAIDFHI